MASILSNESNTILSGTSGNDTIRNGGSWSDGNNNWWLEGGSKITISAGKGNDYIDNTQNGDYSSINAGAGNDTIDGGASFVTIGGGKGNDKIDLHSGGNLIRYSSGDGNDTIRGFNESDTLTITGGSYSTQTSGNDVLVTVGKGRILLKDANGKSLNINKKSTNKFITLNENDYIFLNKIKGATLNGGTGNNVIDNWSGGSNSSISGGAGNDRIWNAAENKNVTISGGKGNDYIINEGDNVLFQYAKGDGNDFITGFNETATLSIGGGSYSTKKSGSDIIVTVGKGKITLASATSLSKVNIVSDTLTVTNSTKSPVTVSSAIKTVNASTRTKAVKITGNSLANTITGGSGKDSLYGGKGNDSIVGGSGNDKLYGQAGNDVLKGGKGNDSLWGGAGNDSLYGGDGKDTFIYTAGEGTDKIFDYRSGDMLKILNSNGKAGSFSKSKFSGGTLSLTIAGGGKVIFDDVAKGDKFNINGTTYKISGSKLVKK